MDFDLLIALSALFEYLNDDVNSALLENHMFSLVRSNCCYNLSNGHISAEFKRLLLFTIVHTFIKSKEKYLFFKMLPLIFKMQFS